MTILICNKCNKPIEKNDLCIRFEGFHSSANMCMPCVEKGVNEQNSIREEIK